MKTSRILAMLLAFAMVLTMGGVALAEDKAEDAPSTLVYATSTFGQKFSPFFATTAYDMEVVDLTQGLLLAADRGGAIVEHGIEGETRTYNGTDYTYYGMGDVEVVQNEDGTVDYNLTMRDDIVFSDGTPADIDDVIFGIYVLCDPTYDGSSTIYAMPIEGMEEYRSGMESLASLLIAAGRDNEDFTYWDADTQAAFWADIDQAGAAFAQEIVDYCKGAGYNEAEDSVAACAANWGFELPEDATAADFFANMVEAYEGDLITLSDTETAGSSLFDLMENFRSPYFSSSIREFWSRWHISLSTWFRDYVYIPLGGNRKGRFRTILNNLITFLVSGLWHGANVTYLVWGGIHGAGQVVENLTGLDRKGRKKSRLRRIIGIPVVFVFVTLAWVFFRAKSLPDAVYVLTHLFTDLEILHPGAYFYNGMNMIFLNWELFFRNLALYILPLAVYDGCSLKTDVPAWIGQRGPLVRYGYIVLLVAVILVYGYVGQSTFVYFQF